MSPSPNTEHNAFTQEDITRLNVEIETLKQEIETLRQSCTNGHRQAAMWAAASGQLMRIIGEERLKELKFKPPSPDYIRKITEQLND